ncbi:TPA: hypothetical protein N6M29_004170 [Escherichia coli]|nr:hypothetical protein [Escherichia coli]HCN1441214.1 hypothetical protein [Escherichia coli]
MDKYQIWEKQKDTIAHKEYLKISDTNLLGHIHIANYEVIQSELSKFNSPKIVFHYSLNGNELKKEHINISRHFLNYISSALSFRDSTRNLHKINVLNIDDITNKSREIINEEFLKNPIIKLMEDLRNILTHQKMISPLISSFMHLQKKINIHGFAFKIETILENDRLSGKSKEYLKSIEQKNLFILPIIEEYQYTTLKYQHWLLACIHNAHQNTYPEYWEARKNIMDVWGGDIQLIPEESTLTYLTR